MFKRILQSLEMSFGCLIEACRSGQSAEYRIWRLKEAFGINPETNRPFFIDKHGCAGVYKHRPCCHCRRQGEYDSKYDSYYCPYSGVWLEEQCLCGGNDCAQFPNRPKKAF